MNIEKMGCINLSKIEVTGFAINAGEEIDGHLGGWVERNLKRALINLPFEVHIDGKSIRDGSQFYWGKGFREWI